MATVTAVIPYFEHFTSQWPDVCALARAEREDVLPLALHVDYWDRLGWADTFASEAFTRRQYAYARTFGNHSVWTPQFVVQGQHFSRGRFREMINERIAEHHAKGPAFEITLNEAGEMLSVTARPTKNGLPDAKVIVVHYSPLEEVKIKRGENAGRKIAYHNVVRSWRVIGRIKGGGGAAFEVPMDMKRPVAVLVQAPKTGRVLAAQVLR